MMMRTDMDMER